MDSAIIQLTISVLPMALFVNILVDIVRKFTKDDNRPLWLLPLACLIFSGLISALFWAVGKTEKSSSDILMQGFSIAGVSYFFYSIGGYDFLKRKFSKVVKNDDKQN